MDSFCEKFTTLFKIYDASNGAPEKAAQLAFDAHGDIFGTQVELVTFFRKVRDSLLLSHQQITDAAEARKRYRRKAALIEREHACNINGCTKQYGSANALKNHRRLKHAGTPHGWGPKEAPDAASQAQNTSETSDTDSTEDTRFANSMPRNIPSNVMPSPPQFPLEHPRMPFYFPSPFKYNMVQYVHGPIQAFAPIPK
tara:strand:- start:5003 stop:5596 length:594 start_codon:yes stop_codon:yes gene_type:complete